MYVHVWSLWDLCCFFLSKASSWSTWFGSSSTPNKFEFSKKSYVSKHVIIDAVDIPTKRKKYHLKADITLFHLSNEDKVDFLKKEPISIAYYDYVNKEMRWDFEYYRGVLEKIIKAQISK